MLYVCSQDGERQRATMRGGGSARVMPCVRTRGFVRGDVMPWVIALGAVAVSAIITKELVVRAGTTLVSRAEAAVVDVGAATRRPERAEDVKLPEAKAPEVKNSEPVASKVGTQTLVETSTVDRAWMGSLPAGVFGPPIELSNDYVEQAGPPAIMAGGFSPDPVVRWFDGRPVRPKRVVWMKVTAYSPDPRSCGDSADGITATLHCVTTNGHQLVAADPKVLPYGSMLTIPGYAIGAGGGANEPAIVPVLDCGGAIKGYRLDVLFPTHEEAMAWGVRELPVTVWGYVDGGEHTNPRKVR
ncbi:MAG TPA: 3D domain-containing protein [Phycisphaerales bacterium]|nr:3D domain-containing protein [Phycisphaerales bacterium]